MTEAFNRPRLQDFLTFYFEDWPNIEAAQLKKMKAGKTPVDNTPRVEPEGGIPVER